MHFKKSLFIVLLCCLVISCSLIKTGYNNAPSVAIWWLNDYFHFSESQNLALKPALQNLHNWHRQNQLPSYVTLLQDMQTSLANEQISVDEACDKLDAIKLRVHTLQFESVPIIIELAPLLSAKQLDYFKKKLVKRTEKWKSDWWQESKQEQLAIRLEKTEDFAEKVYGDLNEEQIGLLKQSLIQMDIDPAISFKEIQRRNEDALQILTELQDQSLTFEDKSQRIKAGIERLQKSPNLAYKNYADALSKHTCNAIANLHTSTSAKQKLHAKNWLNNYIVLLSALQTK
jgi:Family of unknown function (DUF6279)